MSYGQPNEAAAHKTVFLHVGAPKTGTTFLQKVLWKNRHQLAADGVCYPLEAQMEHLPATFDLRQMPWGGHWDPAWEGAWERVAARVRAWTGPVAVISNELLGGATEQQAREAVASLQPAKVHVVFTARDLARQLPSDWQEHLKHRHTVTLTRFVDDLIEHGINAPDPFGEMFWGLHDPVRVLGNWSTALPSERLHLITVPQPGAESGLLWRRFAALVGIGPSQYDTHIPGANTSIGHPEAEFLRRLNLVLSPHRLGDDYPSLVQFGLAEDLLASRANQTRLRLPQKYHDWVAQRSKQLVADVRAAGYDVVGDLDELVPPLPAYPGGLQDDPQSVSAAEVLDVAVESMAGVLEQLGPTRRRVTELEEELTRRRGQPFKTLARDASEKYAVLMWLRVRWWHAVERLRQLRRFRLLPALHPHSVAGSPPGDHGRHWANRILAKATGYELRRLPQRR